MQSLPVFLRNTSVVAWPGDLTPRFPLPLGPISPVVSAPNTTQACTEHCLYLHGLLPPARSPMCTWCTCLPLPHLECTSEWNRNTEQSLIHPERGGQSQGPTGKKMNVPGKGGYLCESPPHVITFWVHRPQTCGSQRICNNMEPRAATQMHSGDILTLSGSSFSSIFQAINRLGSITLEPQNEGLHSTTVEL